MNKVMSLHTFLIASDALVSGYAVTVFLGEEKKKRMLLYAALLFAMTYFRNIPNGQVLAWEEEIFFMVAPMVFMQVAIKFSFQITMIESLIAYLLLVLEIILTQMVAMASLRIFMLVVSISISEEIFLIIGQLIYMPVMWWISHRFKERFHKAYNTLKDYINNRNGGVLRIAKLVLSIGLVSLLSVGGGWVFFHYGGTSNNLKYLMLVTVGILMVIVINYYETILNVCKMQRLEELAKVNEVHNEFVQSLNNFAHSYCNMIQTMDFLVQCEDMTLDDIRPVMKDMVKWNQDNKMCNRLKYVNIPNTLVASVLSLKYEEAQNLGVTFVVEYEGKGEIPLNAKDLLDILNVLLDNAIQAAYYAEIKMVNIKLSFGEEKFCMLVKNRYKVDAQGNIKKYGESRKIGLKHIEKLVEENNSITFRREMEEDVFVVNVQIERKME